MTFMASCYLEKSCAEDDHRLWTVFLGGRLDNNLVVFLAVREALEALEAELDTKV